MLSLLYIVFILKYYKLSNVYKSYELNQSSSATQKLG